MQSSTTSWTLLAHLLRPQGRKGEILADLHTDFPESLTGRKNLFLVPEGYTGDTQGARPIEVLSSWLPVGRNRGRVVLHLDGIHSITEAEALQGLDLAVPDEERMELEDGLSYVSDLTGCSVYDGEVLAGEVTGVQFPSSSEGARLEDVPSLLEVAAPDGNELLIPFAQHFVLSIDLADKKIVMRLPKGLLEINR